MKIKGYASLFHRADLSGDIILPQAFHGCLNRRAPREVKMLYHHDVTAPIGCWHRMTPTSKGLWVEGELLVAASLPKDLATLVAAGAIDGLSIGFRALKSARTRQKQRLIKEIDLLEISLVTFPMQPMARLMTNA